MDKFRSNGKLMLTGEYLALKGGSVIALPLTSGQSLSSERNDSSEITWKSKDHQGNVWFDGSYDIRKKTWTKSSSYPVANRLSQLFQIILDTRKTESFSSGFRIETELEFNREWGWGTSSTLIDLLAQWSQVDPFHLAKNSFGGSMYDIACAQSKGPLFYRLETEKPRFHQVNFNPSYHEKLYFVYLGQKQNSRDAINSFDFDKKYIRELKEIEKINETLLLQPSFEQFKELVARHEKILGTVLSTKPIQERIFSDFNGQIKSLGAWGGDFILAASDMTSIEVKKYFSSRNFITILEYNKIIL